MSNPIDTILPTTPKGNFVNWLSFISIVLIVAFVVDNYWGKGDLFGLAKKPVNPAIV